MQVQIKHRSILVKTVTYFMAFIQQMTQQQSLSSLSNLSNSLTGGIASLWHKNPRVVLTFVPTAAWFPSGADMEDQTLLVRWHWRVYAKGNPWKVGYILFLLASDWIKGGLQYQKYICGAPLTQVQQLAAEMSPYQCQYNQHLLGINLIYYCMPDSLMVFRECFIQRCRSCLI